MSENEKRENETTENESEKPICDMDCSNCKDCDGCDEYEDENLIVLTDETGENVVFELLDTIEYQDEYYNVLFPIDEDEDTDEVVILHVELNDNDDEVYDSVNDEDLVNILFEIFKEQNKNNFNFND